MLLIISPTLRLHQNRYDLGMTQLSVHSGLAG